MIKSTLNSPHSIATPNTPHAPTKSFHFAATSRAMPPSSPALGASPPCRGGQSGAHSSYWHKAVASYWHNAVARDVIARFAKEQPLRAARVPPPLTSPRKSCLSGLRCGSMSAILPIPPPAPGRPLAVAAPFPGFAYQNVKGCVMRDSAITMVRRSKQNNARKV